MAHAVHGTRRAAAAAILAAILLVSGCAMGGTGSAPALEAPPAQEAAQAEEARDEAAGEERSVVVEGAMSVVVPDVAEAAASASRLAADAGGRVEGREEQGDGGSGGWAQLELRIPADRFDSVIDDLRDLGAVDAVSTATTDVTTTVRDVAARLAATESTLARLQSFQDRATGVQDLLAIEEDIAARQAELESLRAEQEELTGRVAYSSLSLSLSSDAAPASSGPDSFGSGFVAGAQALWTFVGGAAVVLGVLAPWLLVGAFVSAAVVVVVRARRRRRARAAAPVEQPVP